ncbi:hypothetical protein MMPV_004610 [Pyropia vietnamensis]
MGILAIAALAAIAVLSATQWGIVPPGSATATPVHAVRLPAAKGGDGGSRSAGGAAVSAATAVAAAPAGQCAHPRSRAAAGGALLDALPTTAYSILSDTVVYSRYARMYDRRVETPAGPIAYDVLGRVWKARGRGGGTDKTDGGGSFAVVIAVPYDASTRTFTLIREYSPAHGRRVYGFAGGVVEAGEAPAAAAAREMEEETRTVCAEGGDAASGAGSAARTDGGGAWVDLLGEPEAAAGAPQDKYQREVVHYYLCTDAVPVGTGAGRPRDADEVMDVVSGVTADALRTVVRGGGMQSNFMAAALLALDELGL